MNEIKIPTVLGVFLLLMGIISGLLLINNNQLLSTEASTKAVPKDVRISNITDSSFTVSWATDNQTDGRLLWGKGKSINKQTQISSPKGFTHWVTVNDLTPLTTYIFKIENNNIHDNNGIPWQVTTGTKLDNISSFTISGKVVTANGLEVNNALVYTTVSGSSLLSTTTNQKGNFSLDISKARNSSLDSFQGVDDNSMLEIFVTAGPFGISSVVSNSTSSQPLPVIVLGKNYSYKKTETYETAETPYSEIILQDDLILKPGQSVFPEAFR